MRSGFARVSAKALEQNETDSSLSLERLVDVEKTATRTILYGLLFFEERMSQNLEVHLEEIKKNALDDINNTINGALEDINLSIHNGEEEGKNVDRCYYYAKNNLESKRTNAVAGLDVCIQNGRMVMESPLANVISSIQAAKKLLSDLDAIIPNCDSTSFLIKQVCVLKNLFLTRESLKSVTKNSGKTIITATGTYVKTFVNVKSCVVKNTVETHTFSMNIVSNTNYCIKTA
ncbi:PREDICTED: uncharacterized protein LOC108768603 isoform X2 [Trachymyrmex cornetzi]|uniref:uncharacterized protein LOC108768603 isoform X2 n=1 Tax=Trachymyrmex cornetzi TaxID=471704 RepID=UPI00084ED997|nr:PREDICTED: uncharacterized protein LOC108768603 isoform X2 [Trachymyrmex cornetzi]